MPVVTDALISRLAGTQQVIRDSHLSALKVRFSKRSISFLFDQQINGKRYRIVIGSYPNITTEQARAICFEQLTGNVVAPAVPEQEAITERITFGDVLRLYLEHKTLREATAKGYVYMVEKYGFVDKPFHDVTPDSFLAWYQDYSADAPTQAKKVAGLIKSLSRWYCQYADLPMVDLTVKVKTLLGISIHESNVKERKLTLHELPKFFNAVSQFRQIEQDAIKFVLLTAIRKGELFSLTSDNFTVKDGLPVMTLEQTKNGRRHELPLPPMASIIIQRRINAVGKGQKLFAMSDNSRIFNQIEAFSGIRVSWHDLRRSWASFAINEGVSELMIKRCLNHVETGVTGKHYAHLSLDSVSKVMVMMEEVIMKKNS